MLTLRSIGIAIAMLCSVFLACLLPASVFAQVARDAHQAKKIKVSAYAALDSLTYDLSGAGVAYLDGSFYLENHDPNKKCSFDFEVRLEMFKRIDAIRKETLTPDAKNKTSGQLNKAVAPWHNIYDSYSDSVDLHVDCLNPKPEEDDTLVMSGTVTLNATIGGRTESWQVREHEEDFKYEQAKEIQGLGPTTDGETFSDNCKARGGDSWQSLIKTGGLYSAVYWYVKAPGDTSALGTNVETDWGDGVAKQTTMTYTFPEDNNVPGRGAYYEITAYVYRWDLSVYWDSYKVWVTDKK